MRSLKTLGVFLVATVVTWIAVAAIGFAYMSAFGIVDRDGGGAMELIFMIGPFFGIIGGVVAAAWMWVRIGRRAR